MVDKFFGVLNFEDSILASLLPLEVTVKISLSVSQSYLKDT